MSGTIYEETIRHMWDIMWAQRHNWPSVQACSDSELRMLWAETEDRYNLYCRIVEQAERTRNPPVDLVVAEKDNDETEEYMWCRDADETDAGPYEDDNHFDDAAINRLYERADEVAAELDSIDFEWRRRPWLQQYI
jgi:hypothetical protein